MSSSPAKAKADLRARIANFHSRNDIHIYINDKLFFGFRTGANVTWGNLCSCMATTIGFTQGNWLFQPRQTLPAESISPTESIPWDMYSRQTFGNCKAYDFLVAIRGGAPSNPELGDISYQIVSLRPIHTKGTNTPSSATSPIDSGTSTPIDTEPQARDVRAARRSSGQQSPIQNKGRASLAPARCWETYKQCCITGQRGLFNNDDDEKPPDIEACHIFPQAHIQEWITSGFPARCTDRGPNDDCDQRYTGYHQICCLNNMVPFRVDIHKLWDAYDIGVDINDDNRVISFSPGRDDLTKYLLDASEIAENHRPLPVLLRDHLRQGVARHCTFPQWQSDGQQSRSQLHLIAEEAVVSEMYEPEAVDPADLADAVAAEFQGLSLGRGAGEDAQFGRRHMSQWEYGKGKSYFETYLNTALSVGHYV